MRDFGTGGAGGEGSASNGVVSANAVSATVGSSSMTGVMSGGGAPTTSSSNVGVTSSGPMTSSGTGPCPPGQESCGLCVDITADSENCGACGHSCLGGKCVSSVCEPVVLTTAQAQPVSLALDAKTIYWANSEDGSILALPKSGGASPLKLAAGQVTPFAVATDGQRVYWVNLGDGNLCSVPVTGGNVTTLATTPDSPSAVAVDSTNVYWATNSKVLYRLKTGMDTAHTIATGQAGVSGLAIADGRVYWTTANGHTVMRGAPGQPTVELANNLFGLWDVEAFQGNLYLLLTDSGQIVRIPMDGGSVTTLVGGQKFPYAVTVDPSGIYWTNNQGGSVMHMKHGSAESEILAVGQNDPGDIVTDGAAIYWLNMAGGAVMKRAK